MRVQSFEFEVRNVFEAFYLVPDYDSILSVNLERPLKKLMELQSRCEPIQLLDERSIASTFGLPKYNSSKPRVRLDRKTRPSQGHKKTMH